MKLFIVLIAGVLFGFGLWLSGMINPTVVLGFLDVFGQWNPALIFVMVGALAVTTIGFRWIKQVEKPLFESKFHISEMKAIDKKLILGSITFGIGWGLSGYCPGPAIAGLAFLQHETILFVFSMFLGFKASQLLNHIMSKSKG